MRIIHFSDFHLDFDQITRCVDLVNRMIQAFQGNVFYAGLRDWSQGGESGAGRLISCWQIRKRKVPRRSSLRGTFCNQVGNTSHIPSTVLQDRWIKGWRYGRCWLNTSLWPPSKVTGWRRHGGQVTAITRNALICQWNLISTLKVLLYERNFVSLRSEIFVIIPTVIHIQNQWRMQ